MSRYYIVAISAVCITAFCQLLLKCGALHGKARNSLIRSYANLYTVTAYSLLLVVTLLNTYAYKYIELKIAVVLLPMTFIMVALLSFFVLGEKLTRNQMVGALLILGGTVVFNL